MKLQPQVTKVRLAKIAGMKKSKAAYCQAIKEGKIKSYQITPT